MSENQKKIWITGASSGIGKAVAEMFASQGWKVAVSARRKELLDELAKNENISSFPLDVTDQSQIKNVFKNILNEFGDLDICLFSSGTYEPKDEKSIDPDKIKNVINVNFLGVIDCVKAVENFFKNLLLSFETFLNCLVLKNAIAQLKESTNTRMLSAIGAIQAVTVGFTKKGSTIQKKVKVKYPSPKKSPLKKASFLERRFSSHCHPIKTSIKNVANGKSKGI